MELLVTLLIDGRAQPLLLPDQVALSEEGGLSAAVEPAMRSPIREECRGIGSAPFEGMVGEFRGVVP